MSVWFHSNPSSRTVMTTPLPVNPFCHTGITWRSSLGRDGVILVSCCGTEGIKIYQHFIHLYQTGQKLYFKGAVNNLSLNLCILLKFCKSKTKTSFIKYLRHRKIYPTAWISLKTTSEQKIFCIFGKQAAEKERSCEDAPMDLGALG